MFNLTRKKWLLLYSLCIGLLFLGILQFFAVHKNLSIRIFDIGQGDAIFIQTPYYHNILIDAGPDSKIVDLLGKKMPFFAKTIDVFILTHPHADHYGGILDIMQKYTIKKIIITGATANDPAYLEFLNIVRTDRDLSVQFATNNQDLQIGPNLYLDILFPLKNQSLIGQELTNQNNGSIVARLMQRTSDEQKNIIILTGDAEEEEEREVLLAGQDVRSEILKIGHHGSKTATSNVFLQAINPKTAVISVGKGNKFNHPHQETIDKLKDITVKRTDLDGDIQFNFSFMVKYKHQPNPY